MKVLGILGSPRKGGNSDILLDRALQQAAAKGASCQKIILNGLKISPCQECGGCSKSGKCVIRDDMQIVYKKLDEAEAVILASPIFFGSLPAQVKAMIDRYQCRWVKKFVLGKKSASNKKGFLILVSATNRKSFFRNAESIVKNFFAVADIEFTGNLHCPDIDQKGAVLKHRECLKRAYNLGKGIGQKRPLT